VCDGDGETVLRRTGDVAGRREVVLSGRAGLSEERDRFGDGRGHTDIYDDRKGRVQRTHGVSDFPVTGTICEQAAAKC